MARHSGRDNGTKIIIAAIGALAVIGAALISINANRAGTRESINATLTAEALDATKLAGITPTATKTHTPIPPTATATPTATPAASPTLVPLTILSIGDGLEEYVVAGDGWDQIPVGSYLVVYGFRLEQEIPVGLLRVIAINPNSLSTQALLVHEDHQIEPNLRVAVSVDLLESELLPASLSADGYYVSGDIARLRLELPIEIGSVLQVLRPITNGEAITDYLPGDKMQIIAIGTEGRNVQIEMLNGADLPELGALLRLEPSQRMVLYEENFEDFQNESFNCQAYSYIAELNARVIDLLCSGRQAITYVNQDFNDFDLELNATKRMGLEQGWYGIVLTEGRGTDREVLHRFMVSGLGTFTYEVATIEGNQQTTLDVVVAGMMNPAVNQGNGTNKLRLIRVGPFIDFYVNDILLLRKEASLSAQMPVRIGMILIAGSQYADLWVQDFQVAYTDLIVYKAE